MKIDTLTSNSYLYNVNRNRQYYLTKMEKRRAFFMVCGLTICTSIVTYIWIIYR